MSDTPTHPTLPDPYENTQESVHRLSFNLPASRYNAIKSVWVYTGAIDRTVGHLIEKLYHELIQRSITTPIDADAFAKLVLNSKLTLDEPRITVSSTDGRVEIRLVKPATPIDSAIAAAIIECGSKFEPNERGRANNGGSGASSTGSVCGSPIISSPASNDGRPNSPFHPKPTDQAGLSSESTSNVSDGSGHGSGVGGNETQTNTVPKGRKRGRRTSGLHGGVGGGGGIV